MATTRITAKGQVTLPRSVREALLLSIGDLVEFHINLNGEVVLRRAPARATAVESQAERVSARGDAQMRRRAEELLELLRGLD